MRHLFTTLTALALLIGITATAPRAHAVEADTVVPQTAVWGLSLDINKLWSSELGQSLERQIGKEADENIDQMLHGISDMLGLDLRTDLGKIVVFGSGFQPQDAAVVVEIGNAQSNIEGLLLAADGYSSYDYGNAIVHSLIPENEGEEKRVYMAVSPNESGLVVASHRKRYTEQLIDSVIAGKKLIATDELQGDRFAHLWVNSIPAEMFEDGAQSNLAAIITGFDLVATSGEQTAVDITVNTTTPARAQQLQQLINGGMAMLQLAAGDDHQAAQLLELTRAITVDRAEGEAKVKLGWSISTSEVNQLFNTLKKLDQNGHGHDHGEDQLELE